MLDRSFTYRPLSEAGEDQQVKSLLAQCFNAPRDRESLYFDLMGRDRYRGFWVGDRFAGALALLPMGQWWNHQRVPMTGIASVGIAPEHRGSGVALAMMQQMLLELHQQNVPLTTLYAAAQRLYRRAGYEQAGSVCGWEIETGSIALRHRPLSVRSIALEADLLMKMQHQQAIVNNGHLDRHPAMWKLLLTETDAPLYAYEFGDGEGYIVFRQEADQSLLKIVDWAVLTAAAGQTFWSFLSDHRSQIDKIRWTSAAIDPLSFWLPEQTANPRFVDRWMLRIVDVVSALELRGYPSDISAELHFEVQDDLITANCDRFCLTVSNGRAHVTRGGRGDLKLDIRGLAPLYTNLFCASQLQQMGVLEGDRDTLMQADRIFTAAPPWMPDFF
ncbi:GNAT family N-acetyltransferase [Microcoleus sp. FACHB-1515]|nr:GNAT family N-acetyltransferase [Microcoleus sp. FACHB-1515]